MYKLTVLVQPFSFLKNLSLREQKQRELYENQRKTYRKAITFAMNDEDYQGSFLYIQRADPFSSILDIEESLFSYAEDQLEGKTFISPERNTALYSPTEERKLLRDFLSRKTKQFSLSDIELYLGGDGMHRQVLGKALELRSTLELKHVPSIIVSASTVHPSQNFLSAIRDLARSPQYCDLLF